MMCCLLHLVMYGCLVSLRMMYVIFVMIFIGEDFESLSSVVNDQVVHNREQPFRSGRRPSGVESHGTIVGMVFSHGS